MTEINHQQRADLLRAVVDRIVRDHGLREPGDPGYVGSAATYAPAAERLSKMKGLAVAALIMDDQLSGRPF